LSYRVTVRAGSRVERERCETVDEAIEIAKRHVRGSRRRDAVELLGRRYDPGVQIAVRIEFKGPNGRAGLDVLGDGGLVAYTGRLVRRTVGEGEDPYEALAHKLSVGP